MAVVNRSHLPKRSDDIVSDLVAADPVSRDRTSFRYLEETRDVIQGRVEYPGSGPAINTVRKHQESR